MARYYSDPAMRDRLNSAKYNRRVRALGQPGITTPRALITYLMDRDGSCCQLCGLPVTAMTGQMGPSIDHIIPLSRGGRHELENVQLAHLRCNKIKGNRLLTSGRIEHESESGPDGATNTATRP